MSKSYSADIYDSIENKCCSLNFLFLRIQYNMHNGFCFTYYTY